MSIGSRRHQHVLARRPSVSDAEADLQCGQWSAVDRLPRRPGPRGGAVPEGSCLGHPSPLGPRGRLVPLSPSSEPLPCPAFRREKRVRSPRWPSRAVLIDPYSLGCSYFQVSLFEKQKQRVGGVHNVHAEAPVHRGRASVRAAPAELHLVSAVGCRRVSFVCALWVCV